MGCNGLTRACILRGGSLSVCTDEKHSHGSLTFIYGLIRHEKATPFMA